MKALSEAAHVQVVFQGGGAKLPLLMAVAEGLQAYATAVEATAEVEARPKKIEITRVAGSSAGAIAAVMLASGKPIGTYKEAVKRLGKKHLDKMKRNNFIGMSQIIFGSSYFREKSLEDFFNELFCAEPKSPQLVGDLRIKDSRLYFTDLYSLASRAAPQDDPIPKALAKSCRFPFAFVGYSSGDTHVDGGLASNLPVDELKANESVLGSVIGVSFLSKFGDTNKSNLRSYTQQIFSAAIQSSVARSELAIGKKNVFPIDTEIGTFDFDRALNEGLNSEYTRIGEKFDTWLATWLKSSGPIEPVGPGRVQKLLRPSLTASTFPISIIREINDRIEIDPSTNAQRVELYDTAMIDASGNFTGNYISRTVKTFRVVRNTNILQFDFQTGKDGTFAKTNLGCAAFDSQGSKLNFTPHIEELTKPNDELRSFRVYFLFDEPITPATPNQPFRVEYQYEGDNPYPNLKKGCDAAILTLRQGGTASALLCVAFPRSIFGSSEPKVTDLVAASPGQLSVAKFQPEDEGLIASESMSLLDFVEPLALHHEPDRYVCVGRRVLNAKPKSCFGFVIEKP
jgi:predicted acylesterase/phospholipase RssA